MKLAQHKRLPAAVLPTPRVESTQESFCTVLKDPTDGFPDLRGSLPPPLRQGSGLFPVSVILNNFRNLHGWESSYFCAYYPG